MGILDIIEVVGVASFAASGAIVAIQKKLDIFGILVLSFVTAVGGGVIRDVVMGTGVPAFFSSYLYAGVILVTSCLVMLTKGRIRLTLPFIMIDALGLAVFTVVAGVKARDSGMNLLAFLFVSLITGIGGSVLRDLMVMEIPTILRREIYATAVLIGALALWFLSPLIGKQPAIYLSIAIVFAVRVVSYMLNLHLLYNRNTEPPAAAQS
jgi:uncharacterized membrane protein YeiH